MTCVDWAIFFRFIEESEEKRYWWLELRDFGKQSAANTSNSSK